MILEVIGCAAIAITVGIWTMEAEHTKNAKKAYAYMQFRAAGNSIEDANAAVDFIWSSWSKAARKEKAEAAEEYGYCIKAECRTKFHIIDAARRDGYNK
ncbi:hypothetical protein [Vibrio chagasii]|uniref:hypothetical protein n=1 Tax=Vibrio chagasii TaxID=170679 RepID=UPI003DA03071